MNALLVRAPVRDADQGIAADAARPRHRRPDGDAADGPAVPVRLRDQCQSAASADRAAHGGTFHLRAHARRRAAEHRVLRHPSDGDRGAGRTGAGARRRDVRAEHTAGLLAPGRPGRAAAGADGRRCHRPDRDRQRDRGRGGAEHHGAEPRSAGGHAGAAAAAAVPDRAARPLQSGADHRAEYRARADRSDPDGLHAGDDDTGDHARTRDRARWRTCWRRRCVRWR